MARYSSCIGDKEACEDFARTTRTKFRGWWYHATTEEDAIKISTGKSSFDAGGQLHTPIYFSRSPKGGAKGYGDWEKNPWIIAATINAVEIDPVDTVEGMKTDDEDILSVRDVRCIMVLKGFCHHRDEGMSVEAHLKKETGADKTQESDSGDPSEIKLDPIEPGAGKRITRSE